MDVQQQRAEDHPLYKPLMAAIHQAMFGKGVRHGGATVPWLEQPIFHYANMHGRGFLTGQAAKKLEEAANTRHGEAFITEVLGAIVYCGAALIREQQLAAERGEDRISFDRVWPWLGEEPLVKIDLSRMQAQQQQGHDGPGGVIHRDPAAWARYAEQRNTGRFGGGRFDKAQATAPSPEVDREVWATRAEPRNCDTCKHKHIHIEALPCSECHPRHDWPSWEPRQS